MSTVENIVNKQYICNHCNKIYKDKTGLWYHNKKYHITKVSQNEANKVNIVSQKSVISQPTNENLSIDKLYKCKFCDNTYKHKQSKFKHEKICKTKINDENTIQNQKEINKKLTDKIIQLEKEMKQLVNKINKGVRCKNINNGSINIINNNSINICKFGDEEIPKLSEKEKETIINEGLDSIIYLIEYINFNEKLPQNHNFCVSAINDKYVNVYDKQSNSIIKRNKKDTYDCVLVSNLNRLDTISGNNKTLIDIVERLRVLMCEKKPKKTFHVLLNELSYNKGHIVENTWKNSNQMVNELIQIAESQNKSNIENIEKEYINNKYDSDISSIYSSDSEGDINFDKFLSKPKPRSSPKEIEL
jgi:hypothetical protein